MKSLNLKIILLSLLAQPMIGYSHPHSFIDLKTTFIIEDANLIGINYHWLLDEMTTMSLFESVTVRSPQIPSEKIKIAVGELIDTITPESFFTYLYQDQETLELTLDTTSPKATVNKYKMDLNFSLKLIEPISLLHKTNLMLLTYEPTFYVDMRYMKHRDIDFNQALPKNCTLHIDEPDNSSQLKELALTFDYDPPEEDFYAGRLLAQKVIIKCL